MPAIGLVGVVKPERGSLGLSGLTSAFLSLAPAWIWAIRSDDETALGVAGAERADGGGGGPGGGGGGGGVPPAPPEGSSPLKMLFWAASSWPWSDWIWLLAASSLPVRVPTRFSRSPTRGSATGWFEALLPALASLSSVLARRPVRSFTLACSRSRSFLRSLAVDWADCNRGANCSAATTFFSSRWSCVDSCVFSLLEACRFLLF